MYLFSSPFGNKIQSDFDRIANAADKMDALLSDLLELSRIGRIVNPPFEINSAELIQESLDSVDARIRSKNVIVNIEKDFPTLYGDCIRLREVFENLIDNAVKYMGEQKKPVIDIGIRRQNNEQIIYVKDNGLGIEEKYHERVFRLFEKQNPSVEGTGIGLTLVKRIIETHGGQIWVESEGSGKGTTFCFTLPKNNLLDLQNPHQHISYMRTGTMLKHIDSLPPTQRHFPRIYRDR